MTIAEKVRALIEKARSTDNEYEAEAFLDKANELMEKYQITEAELGFNRDPVIENDGVVFSSKSHSWMWELYRAVGVYYGCKSIRISFYKEGRRGDPLLHYRQVLCGRESAIITSDIMYEYLKREVTRHGKRIAEKYGDISPAAQSRRVGAALISRIWRIIPEKPKPKTEAAKKFALITMDEVESKFNELHPNAVALKPINSKFDSDSMDAAMSMNFNLQTKGAAGRMKLNA